MVRSSTAREDLTFSLDSHNLREFALPRIDFEALFKEQLGTARRHKERARSDRSLRERFLDLIEGPWAPAAHDLPEKRQAPGKGPSSIAYRTPSTSLREAETRQKIKHEITKSEYRWPLTKWSSVYEYDVPIANLPQALSGFTILHLSDIHFLKGHEQSCRELSQVASFLEAGKRRIDTIMLSGDIITRSPEDLDKHALRQLARMSAVCPQAFMVYGNHDYHGHTPALISRELERVGFHDINNNRVTLSIEGAPLNIYGIDDAYFGTPVPPSQVNAGETNIILTHNLDAIRSHFPKHIDLILSGHTHWGETRFFDGSGIMRMWGYCDDINRHTKAWDTLTNRTLSYVHPGLARYYVPFRYLRHPPGIAIHTLRHTDMRHD
jgi:predicted MPP superfamily phosphohydrolase